LPDDLVAAVWLHDIGYAPDLVQTGFHPLDGARFLRCAGVDGQVVSLMAYHSCARAEAAVRGLAAELAAEFTPAGPLLTDAPLYCDMTTGPGR
jgi:HD superfamily phosphodiesterase